MVVSSGTKSRPRTAILAAGGPLTAQEAVLLAEFAQETDVWVGVDSGTRHWLSIGILPHYVTGDFDSLSVQERESLAKIGVKIVPTPDQDYTDLDKAIAFVSQELGIARLRIFAGTAGRLDHTYSVLSTVVKYGRALDIRLVDEVGETWLVNGTETLTGEHLPGRVLSLMAMGTVTGITTTGVVWELEGETLAPGFRDGTLNVIKDTTVGILVEEGNLLVMLHHPPASSKRA